VTYQSNRACDTPDPDTVIWRYMDLSKFVLLLDRAELWFSRVDHLGDDHEGALAQANLAARSELFEQLQAHELAEGLESAEGLSRIMRQSMFANCWNIAPQENYLLWTAYGKGVAVRSTCRRLIESLARAPHALMVGRVQYIDYRTEAIPDDQLALRQVLYKRKYFEQEHELRALITGINTNDDHTTIVWQPDPRRGIATDVDLDVLIQEVRIAPGEERLRAAAEAVMRRAGLSAQLHQSSLDDPPSF
jgi:hypothetical protein